MNKPTPSLKLLAALLTLFTTSQAAVSFLGVAAGDASTTSVTLWTRAVDSAAPANVSLMLNIGTDASFATGVTRIPGCVTDSTKDYTCKLEIAGLADGTVYFYRFVGPTNELSNTGRFKTAPASSVSTPLHFAFSGDYDGLIRPYALASVIPSQNLDFYVNLGDVIYENASNLTATGPHNGQPWLDTPSVTLSGSSANLNGPPTFTGFATAAQLQTDYEKKYRENFLPVNAGGQNSLQVLYAAQGNYTTWDNHELGNRQYINGGAPAGGSIGGATGTDMPTGRGVDARATTDGNPNDVNTSLNDYINRSVGFQTLQNVFVNYQPIADRGAVNNPLDPRTHGTRQLYSAQLWGKNAIYINTDTRSYRDLRLKIANGSADDTRAPRANNPSRTYLGATQLEWLEQTLLDAQNAGTPWKFVSLSDPIDQIGPIGGALTLTNLPDFGPGSTYSPVNADGGKSYIGGYRAERNALLKFIADNRILNVVFIATDDHQNRINEVTYSPTDTENQATYVNVPASFSIVAGPLGATGPDLIKNHTFDMVQQYSNSLVAAQRAAKIEPIGLVGYPGLHDLVRDGDPTAGSSPQPADFYSPDTFNFNVLDVTADGKTLTVTSIGMDSTAQNSGTEYTNGPQARTIFSFQVDAATLDTEPGTTRPAIASVTNAFSANPTIAPNTWVTITGSSLASRERTWLAADFKNNQLPTSLDGVTATFNGKSAYIYSVGPNQINVLTPPSLPLGPLQVQVVNNGATSTAFSVQAQALSPAFFVLDGTHVTARHANGNLIGPTSLYPGLTTPAIPGETVTLLANGFGVTSVPMVSGATVQSGTLPALPLVRIGGVQATVQFAGLVGPGQYQFNVAVPLATPDGENSLTATYNGLATQAGVVLTVRR